MDLNDILESSYRKYPDKIAIKYKDQSYTYTEFYKRVCQLANALKREGVNFQEKVALICLNSNAYLEVFFACAKIGAISGHLNWRLSPIKILQMLEDSPTKVIFMTYNDTLKEIYQYLMANLSYQATFVFIGNENNSTVDYEEYIQGMPQSCESVELDDSDIAIQLYTSGTTGKPKGVLLTTENIVTQTFLSAVEGRLIHDEVFLLVSPLFHSICISIFQVICVGGQIVISESTTPGEIAKEIEGNKITRITLVPSSIKNLVDYLEKNRIDTSSLRIIGYGGAPMSPELMARCKKNLTCGFYQAYGMTETTATLTVLVPEDHLDIDNLKTVGKPLMGIKLKIVDERGEKCEIGKIGEIAVKGKTIMKGYWNNPEQTNTAIKDGWYYTGDLGFVDSKGFLHLLDRKGNMIISGGENIYPSEVAACIRSMGPDILEAEVAGVPDEKWGETVMAVVVKRQDSPITADDIKKFCKNNIGSFKKPKYVYFSDKIPRNESGKVVKKDLQKIHFEKLFQRI